MEGYPLAYACRALDDDIRQRSTSGGLFFLLASSLIKHKNACIYGAMFDSAFNVVHSCVNSVDDLSRLMGSKYPQSQVGDAFLSVKSDLEADKYVFFVGTPCQIAGLKSFIGGDCEKLICMDFVCHGVGSNGIWNSYVKELSKKGEIQSIVFKDKLNGWKHWYFRVNYSDGSFFTRRGTQTVYMRSYLNYVNVRPSCYYCRFKGLERTSDLTIADAWGVAEKNVELNDNKGLSSLMINTEKGRILFESIKDEIICQQYEPIRLMEGNWTSTKSIPLNEERRKRFFDLKEKKGDIYALYKSFKPGPLTMLRYYANILCGKER